MSNGYKCPFEDGEKDCMVADKDKSEAFQVECLSSRESPMHFALLHFALDLTSLLVMPSTDQH